MPNIDDARLADMTNTALPGPHPHEAGDIRAQGGNVAAWRDPMEGHRDEAPTKKGSRAAKDTEETV